MNDIPNNDASESMRLDMLRWAESGNDYDKAVSLAVLCSRSSDRWLQVNALHCFGYIARVYKRLDLGEALPLIHAARGSADAEVSGAAQDALDDLETFLPHFALKQQEQDGSAAPPPRLT